MAQIRKKKLVYIFKRTDLIKHQSSKCGFRVIQLPCADISGVRAKLPLCTDADWHFLRNIQAAYES